MATNLNNWFDVSRQGLAELIERRGGKVWLLHELLSNAFDENVTTVKVTLEPEPGKPFASLVVEDDSPDGWKDLRDSYTLFAPSKKKQDAEKRGRFNMGEKLVLALCREATIITTTGGMLFAPDGRRSMKQKRERGSEFSAYVRMTREELTDALIKVRSVIAPEGVTVTINGERLPERTVVKTVRACLSTEHADADGILRRTFRHTEVRLYHPIAGAKASIFELGVPVCETGDTFDLDVRQRVPLNIERDNVTPSYLKDLRSTVLSEAHQLLDGEAKAAAWVTDALTDPCFTNTEAINAVVTARFGEKRVAYDPSDKEANNRAVAEGYTVVHGRQLPAEAWEKIRTSGLIPPAGRVVPTPKVFADDAPVMATLEIGTLEEHKQRMVGLFGRLGKVLLGRDIKIEIADEAKWTVVAAYGAADARLILNVHKVPWNDNDQCIALALHEFAHAFSENHLSDEYHKAICNLGAKLALEVYAHRLVPWPTDLVMS